MRPVRGVVWGCALALLAAGAVPCQAAWCNVFQVCCAGCDGGQVTAGYAPVASDGCCNPCPQQVCTTRYVQRCYYQPVVSYQTRSYYEPVTSYRTSYYYEPVTSYRYSCYYDPCTCSYQQVACPTTCYQLRSQCCPVQSWVQRCCQVPVTTYQQSSYWEPVTSCCQAPCPAPCPTPAPAPVPSPPTGPPGVIEQRTAPLPGVNESRDSGTTAGPYNSYRQIPVPAVPPTGLRRQVPFAPQAPAPSVRFDRIVMGTAPSVEGEVVRGDRAPDAGVEVMFVHADRQGARQSIKTDNRGQFRTTLASGSWLVYVRGADGKPVFQNKIEVRDEQTRRVTLVSR